MHYVGSTAPTWAGAVRPEAELLMSGAQRLLQLHAALLICKAKLTSTPLQSHLLREGLGKANQGREEGRSLCSWQLRSSCSRGCNVQSLKLLAPLQKELAASCPSSQETTCQREQQLQQRGWIICITLSLTTAVQTKTKLLLFILNFRSSFLSLIFRSSQTSSAITNRIIRPRFV